MIKNVYKSLFVFSLCFAGFAQAQFVGPGAQLAVPETVFSEGQHADAINTVADILKNPVDDMNVRLRGKLTRKLRREHYEFSDGTGVIRVEIDDKIFVKQPVDEKTLVELFGEVEKEFTKSPEIDVKSMHVVPPK